MGGGYTVHHTACRNSPCARTAMYNSQRMVHTIGGIIEDIESVNGEPVLVGIFLDVGT